MGLATKITLPFLTLFAAVLGALGWVLAREILQEVESRVVSEQRFVLEVATYSGFAPTPELLGQILDRATRSDAAGPRRPRGQFVVLQDGTAPLTTYKKEPPDGLVRDIEAMRRSNPKWNAPAREGPPLRIGDIGIADIADHNAEEEPIEDLRATLGGKEWLVLRTSRTARMSLGARRYFFLLYPYAEIEDAKNRALNRILALGGLGLFLAAGLGMLTAHWIARPIRRLAAAAQRVSAGGLNAPLGPDVEFPEHAPGGRDEIAGLALAIRAMLETLRTAQQDLLKSERLAVAGKLATTVAHEIRNPLTSLRMTVQMLQQRAKDPDKSTQEAHRILLSEIDRLSLAVEELLTVARPRPPVRAPMDLNALATDTLAFLERQLSHAKIKSVTDLDPEMPRDLPLDAGKIKQVLVNLILNAMQAIVRDGTVTVRTHWDAAAKRAQLSVEDNGPGVPEAVRATLFELFVSTKTGGGGMGLAITKQIAEEHGGMVGFESEPKRTVFTVTLPV